MTAIPRFLIISGQRKTNLCETRSSNIQVEVTPQRRLGVLSRLFLHLNN